MVMVKCIYCKEELLNDILILTKVGSRYAHYECITNRLEDLTKENEELTKDLKSLERYFSLLNFEVNFKGQKAIYATVKSLKKLYNDLLKKVEEKDEENKQLKKIIDQFMLI